MNTELRDQLAITALPSLMEQLTRTTLGDFNAQIANQKLTGDNLGAQLVARLAYIQADAMLAEREKR